MGMLLTEAGGKTAARPQTTQQVTDGGKEALLQDGDELVVDVDGQVADDLSVFGQVEILQAVLLLSWRTLLHELLLKTAKHKKEGGLSKRLPTRY